MTTKCGKCGSEVTPSYERKKPEDRKREILNAAVDLARKVGYTALRRADIAQAAGCSAGLITPSYFPTMLDLQNAVMREAVRLRIPEIIAQGLAIKDPIARQAPEYVKRNALELLA